ncbi:hypothetical protein CPC08DRAFT_764350 [Agrocybe pediades]|nr:hypothetical protein CPC08DRAFT_764350 [Agrocybe pediades]
MSKVVFVGNVPYNMTEEQLVGIFKSVGQVIGFRLVFDRDTAKPKGYGFCEFAGTSIPFFQYNSVFWLSNLESPP